jgi:hypothetical protein
MAVENIGAGDKFRLPRGHINDQLLMAIARAFASDALPLKASFIEYGMPAGFLEDLTGQIRAFESAVNAQEGGRRESITATAAIEEAIERGMQLVRRLDAIVRNVFRDQPAKLAAWESARHIEHASHRSKERPPAPAPPVVD